MLRFRVLFWRLPKAYDKGFKLMISDALDGRSCAPCVAELLQTDLNCFQNYLRDADADFNYLGKKQGYRYRPGLINSVVNDR